MQNLRVWREKQGWSRSQLAEKVQVHESTIKRWEKGLTEPFPYNMALLKALGFQSFSTTPVIGASPMLREPERKGFFMQEPREQPSTYFVQDRSNQDEIDRLVFQDRIITDATGGVLPEFKYPDQLHRVLDVGCGTGGWLIETAHRYPSIKKLVGVDISANMLEYARTQAEATGVSHRIEFRTMDALRMLEFPNDYFDLVNLRFCQSWLRAWDWPKLLQEFKRVLRRDGSVRISDNILGVRNEAFPAFATLNALSFQAFRMAGHAIEHEETLPDLLKQHGFVKVQTRQCQPLFMADTSEGKLCIEDLIRVYRTMLPFLRKWTQVPENYEAIYQQFVHETQQPTFSVQWTLVIAWGFR